MASERKFKFGDKVTVNAPDSDYHGAFGVFIMDGSADNELPGTKALIRSEDDDLYEFYSQELKQGWVKLNAHAPKRPTRGKPVATTPSGFKVYRPSKALDKELDREIKRVKSGKAKYRKLDLNLGKTHFVGDDCPGGHRNEKRPRRGKK